MSYSVGESGIQSCLSDTVTVSRLSRHAAGLVGLIGVLWLSKNPTVDRWLAPYRLYWAARLSDLKRTVEEDSRG